MSLATMGSAIILTWTTSGSTTWIFDNHDSFSTIKTSHVLIFEKYWSYLFSEIDEVR
jgi:hypothetical protein